RCQNPLLLGGHSARSGSDERATPRPAPRLSCTQFTTAVARTLWITLRCARSIYCNLVISLRERSITDSHELTAPRRGAGGTGMPTVVLIGTLDTKGREYAWLRDELGRLGCDVIAVDVGTREPAGLTPQIDHARVAAAGGADLAELRRAGDRGAAVAAMGEGAAAVLADLLAEGRLHGVLAMGGSGGSSIAARAVRDLPIGLPKLIVSTMAAGDVSPYVGAKDVTMTYSVVDIAGINRISRQILGNAAAAVAGMARAYQERPATEAGDRPLIG